MMNLHLAFRGMLLAALCAAACAPAHAQPAPTIAQLVATAAPDDRPLLSQAMSAPPEFAADAFLRMSSRSAQPAQARKDTLAVVWSLAEKAPMPFPMVAAAVDTASGTVDDRLDQTGLDKLSLQARAIGALSELDPSAARARFASLSLAQLPPRYECSAESVADPTPYYEAAATVMNHLPDAPVRLALFIQIAASTRNAMQVAPLMRLFRSLPALPPAERARAVAALTTSLDRVRGDDPMFSKSSATVLAEFPLLSATLAPSDKTTATLKAALRNYLLAHFQGARCRANVEGEVFAQEAQNLVAEPEAVGLRREQAEDFHRAIAVQDVQTVPATSAAQLGEQYYLDGWNLAQQILNDPAPAPSKPEHVRSARQFLDALRFAAEPDTPSFDRYRSRVGALRRLAELLPDDDIKQAADETLFELMESSPLYFVDRAAWFKDAKAMVDGSNDGGSRSRERSARKLVASSNPVFRLYGQLYFWERRVRAR